MFQTKGTQVGMSIGGTPEAAGMGTYCASATKKVSPASPPMSYLLTLHVLFGCPEAPFSHATNSSLLPVLSQLLTDLLTHLLSSRQQAKPWGDNSAQDFGLGDKLSHTVEIE